jgi:hypothetical protein
MLEEGSTQGRRYRGGGVGVIQNVGQNGTNICFKLKVKVGKIWSKFAIKMVKVMKSFAILTISKLWSCLR